MRQLKPLELDEAALRATPERALIGSSGDEWHEARRAVGRCQIVEVVGHAMSL